MFFVKKNLLRKSYNICCVTRQESIHAFAYFPTRATMQNNIRWNYFSVLDYAYAIEVNICNSDIIMTVPIVDAH